MKFTHTLLLLLTLFTILTAGKCNKEKEDQLPPETTTGAMTFGCRINGKVFVPRDGNGKPGLFVEYTYLGDGRGGGWYLNIPAADLRERPNVGISITTDSLLVEEGATYNFKNKKGWPQAFYYKSVEYHKMDNDPGALKIIKFDRVNRIISGTFFFEGTDTNTGEKINVTDGRFDVKF